MFLGEDETIECHRIIYKSDKMGVKKTILPYTVEDILSRYRLVQTHLEANEIPPKDFVKEYDEETVEQRHELGLISVSAYKKWKSSHGPRGKGKEKLGDWPCSGYCPYETLCWGEGK